MEEVFDYLKIHKIKYALYKHKAVFTVAESHGNKDIQRIPGLGTKSLFLKSQDGNFYLVCMPGIKRLNIKQLENELKVKHIKFASPEELKSELNLTPGSVSIFGMINSKSTNLILDKEVFDSNITCFHPNINTATLSINHEDLEKFLNSLNADWKVIPL